MLTQVNRRNLCSWCLTLFLTSCAGPTAAPGEVITARCDGMEWRVCYQALAKRCGSAGYRLINQITDAGSSAGANNDSLVTGSLTRRSVVAQCNNTPS